MAMERLDRSREGSPASADHEHSPGLHQQRDTHATVPRLPALGGRATPQPGTALPPGALPLDLPAPSSRALLQLADRALDLLIASLALVLVAPLLVVIALAVRLTSPGPVVYRQTRVGLDRRRGAGPGPGERRHADLGGAVFEMYKFRSMREDAERETGAVWARPGDPRTTPLGRVLRACRLDELPQLVNVLRGEMRIVGPRPERPDFVSELRTKLPAYDLRHRVRPGITGWAQVHRPSDTCLDDVRCKLAYDLEYVQRHTPIEDLKIMLRTIPVVLFHRSGW